MKTNVFRFVINRPVQRLNREDPSFKTVLLYEKDTKLLQGLLRFKVDNDREGMQQIAQEFIRTSSDYVKSYDQLSFPIKHIDNWVFERGKQSMLDDLKPIVLALTNQSISDLVSSEDYQRDRLNTADSLLAHYIANTPKPKGSAFLARAIRIFGVLDELSKNAQNPKSHLTFPQALKATIVLPANLFPLPKQSDRGDAARNKIYNKQLEVHTEIQKEGQRKSQSITSLEKTRSEILSAFEEDLDLDRREVKNTRPLPHKPQPPNPPADAVGLVGAKQDRVTGTFLSENAIQSLSTEAIAVLNELKINTKNIHVFQTINKIEDRINFLSRQLYTEGPSNIYARIGSAWVPTEEYKPTVYELPTNDTICPRPGNYKKTSPESPDGPNNPLPSSHAGLEDIKAPFADLMLVEQTLVRYELGEIAHIENILQGEIKERKHRRTKTVEQVLFTETERTEDTTRDLQTTERYEIQNEIEKIVKEDLEEKAGLEVSGSYGPSIDFSANASLQRDTAKEDANKMATNYSRELIERAVSRIQERVLEQRTHRELLEIEESNLHTLDNKDGNKHIRGVYRWVDKVYKAQVVNYGHRLMFEMIIPEPAAFLKFALAQNQNNTIDIEKPVPPGYYRSGTSIFVPLRHENICRTNYSYWVSKYEATGVNPPPPTTKIVGKAFKNSNLHNGYDTSAIGDIRVPTGYLAKRAWMRDHRITQTNGPSPATLAAIIGLRYVQEDGGTDTVAMNNEDGDLPISVAAVNLLAYSFNIEVECLLSPEAYAEWQLATYHAIMTAYREQLSRYEEQISSSQIDQGIRIQGNNPKRNEHIIRDELKRSAISLMTDQHFDDFAALRKGVGELQYPQLDLDRAKIEGPYMRFFEQAFEWQHMAYVFYPYYWGRKDGWTNKVMLDDNDPLFADFLRAGSARLVIPARPDFALSVVDFLNKGWPLQDSLDVLIPEEDDESQQPYLSLVAEIQSRQGYDAAQGIGTISVVQSSREVSGNLTVFDAERDNNREIFIHGMKYFIESVSSPTQLQLSRPYEGNTENDISYSFGLQYIGEPWEVRIPTSLVYLEQDTDSLPSFS